MLRKMFLVARRLFFDDESPLPLTTKQIKHKEHIELLDKGIDNRSLPEYVFPTPVDVTDCEGPLIGAWEFPDPIMQADADLRKRIADLEIEVATLTKEVSDLEMKAICSRNALKEGERLMKLALEKSHGVDRLIENSAVFGVRRCRIPFAN